MENFMVARNEKSAQVILENVFRRAHHEDPAEDPAAGGVELAVGLLLLHPSLAHKTYLTKRAPTARFPIFILAQSGASLEQIRSIFGLYANNKEDRQKLEMVNRGFHSRILPKPELIQVMEGGKASLDVLAFLVEKCPGLLKHEDANGGVAVHKFFRRWGHGFYHNERFEQCDNLAFSMIQSFPGCCDLGLFWLALQVRSSDRVVDFAVQQLLNGECKELYAIAFEGFLLSVTGAKFELSVRDVKAICRLLPQAKKFSFDPRPGRPTPDAFRCLMNGLRDAKQLQDVTLSLNVRQLLKGREAERRCFRQALANSSFERLRITATGLPVSADTMLGDIVEAARHRSQPLECLTIEGGGGDASVASLMGLLTSNCARRLVLRELRFFAGDEPLLGTLPPKKRSSSCLADLVMVGCSVASGGLPSFFGLLSNTSLLKRLVLRPHYLRGTTPRDTSTLVTGRSEQGKVLVEGLLRLVKSNTTLEQVDCDDNGLGGFPALLEEVHYHLHLNRHGKKLARDIETSKATFVGLLANVADDKPPLGRSHYPGDASILYGLLRESPSVWLPRDQAKKRCAAELEAALHLPLKNKRRVA